MSKFLAPIHTWLFNKIRIQEALEKDLIESFRGTFGDSIDAIVIDLENIYGSPLEDRPIEDLIDTSNIHGWLQNRISMAETRQAALLAEVFNKYGNTAEQLAFEVFEAQGNNWGLDAKQSFEVTNAPEIHQALNSYILDGMPCDNVNNITIKESDRLQWQNSKCLHRGYWEKAGADVNTLYSLRAAWIKAFVENSNDNFTYEVSVTGLNGQPCFIHEIIRK